MSKAFLNDAGDRVSPRGASKGVVGTQSVDKDERYRRRLDTWPAKYPDLFPRKIRRQVRRGQLHVADLPAESLIPISEEIASRRKATR